MTDLRLGVLDGSEWSGETQQLLSVAETLLEPESAPGSGPVTALHRRKEACQTLGGFVEMDQRVGVASLPVVRTVLREEIERSFDASADDMFKRPLSNAIESKLLAILVNTTTPESVAAFEDDFLSLVDLLGRALVAVDSRESRIDCIEGLNTVSWVFPAEIVELVAVPAVVRELVALLPELSTETTRRTVLHLLAVLTTRDDDVVNDPEDLFARIEVAAPFSDYRCQAFALAIAEALDITTTGIELNVRNGNPIAVLREAFIRNDDLGGRRLRAQALGELVATCPTYYPDAPSELVDRVRVGTDRSRSTLARALGFVVVSDNVDEDGIPRAVYDALQHDRGYPLSINTSAIAAVLEHQDESTFPERMLSDVVEASGDRRREIARALGKVALEVDEDQQEVPEHLADQITDENPVRRSKARRAIGELVAASAFGREGAESLRAEIADKDGYRDLEALVVALGEVTTERQFYEDAVLDAVVSELRDSSGTRRLAGDYVLGRLVLGDAPLDVLSTEFPDRADEDSFKSKYGNGWGARHLRLRFVSETAPIDVGEFANFLSEWDSESEPSKYEVLDWEALEARACEAVLEVSHAVVANSPVPRHPALKTDLRRFVTDGDGVPDRSRLAAVLVLSVLE
ncbi:hypothetical protein [Halorubellus litoreus]|uniref:HEAT repeat-containing protein n=1 Tax=Halorubellus litoreus TaxID=755308 RepID=A0ABD5VHL4_9EURY